MVYKTVSCVPGAEQSWSVGREALEREREEGQEERAGAWAESAGAGRGVCRQEWRTRGESVGGCSRAEWLELGDGGGRLREWHTRGRGQSWTPAQDCGTLTPGSSPSWVWLFLLRGPSPTQRADTRGVRGPRRK